MAARPRRRCSMALKGSYDKQEEIPEEYREIYSERGGKWECTGIEGMRTQADVDRLQVSLTKERTDHKAAKDTLKAWTALGETPDEVHEKLDLLPELEAAAKGKLEEAQIDEMVTRRVEGVIKSKTAPLERQIQQFKEKVSTLEAENGKLLLDATTRSLHDAVRASGTGKIRNEAFEDAFMHAERAFERNPEGKIVTRDGVPGVTPGQEPEQWLAEVLPKKPHWQIPSKGGGTPGMVAGIPSGKNPWHRASWNLTEQGKVVRELGMDKAIQLAEAVGSTVGATKPPPKPE
jgi:hypothetical protein